MVPGEKLLRLPESGVIRVGNGIADDGTFLLATRVGVLQQAKGAKLWVSGRQTRYIPSTGDPVLGVITGKYSENYDVDIGAPFLALLPVLAFEGATRRNRPMLKEGDLVYCRVDQAHRDLQPTVTCMDAAGNAAGFGPLKGGFVFPCGSVQARMLVARNPPQYLKTLGQAMQFELAVGLNGRVWVDAAEPEMIIFLGTAIQACEGKPTDEAEGLIIEMLQRFK